MLANRRLFVMKSRLKKKVNRFFEGEIKSEKRPRYMRVAVP